MKTMSKSQKNLIDCITELKTIKPDSFLKKDLIQLFKEKHVPYYIVLPNSLIKYGYMEETGDYFMYERGKTACFRFTEKLLPDDFLKKNWNEISNWSKYNDTIRTKHINEQTEIDKKRRKRLLIKTVDIDLAQYDLIKELSEKNDMTLKDVLNELIKYAYNDFSCDNELIKHAMNDNIIDKNFDIRNMSLKSIIDFARVKEPNAKITAIVTVTTQTEL